jgi:hypothetical protein
MPGYPYPRCLVCGSIQPGSFYTLLAEREQHIWYSEGPFPPEGFVPNGTRVYLWWRLVGGAPDSIHFDDGCSQSGTLVLLHLIDLRVDQLDALIPFLHLGGYRVYLEPSDDPEASPVIKWGRVAL